MLIRSIADNLLANLAPVDPDAAQAAGDGSETLIPRLAPADFDARASAYRRALAALDDAEDRDGEDRILGLAMRERVESELALDDAGFTRALLAPLATPVHRVREVFDSLPKGSAADWETIRYHLAQVPRALDEYRATLLAAAAEGQTASQRQITLVADQCATWVDVDAFYTTLIADCPNRAALEPEATAATLATADFADFLRTTLLPTGHAHDGVGRDVYATTSRAFLGTDVNLDETYALGWQQLVDITAEMHAVARDIGGENIDEAAAILDASPRYRPLPERELIAWLRQRIAETADAIDGHHFDLPPAARLPECRLTRASEGVMYYAPPDASLSRPGRIVWTPETRTARWRSVTTVHHEGIPGHHLQIATALAEPSLHPWQRSMAHTHGYAEGWAHYSERLCDEIGLLRDPGERLGMLFGQRWRAARIVIDMGLHLGLPIPAGNGLTSARRWTRDVAIEALRTASGAEGNFVTFEVDRYLGWPGQALAFRTGAGIWQDIRAAAERRGSFDLKEFHMAALRLGPMGLAPLKEALLS